MKAIDRRKVMKREIIKEEINTKEQYRVRKERFKLFPLLFLVCNRRATMEVRLKVLKDIKRQVRLTVGLRT